MNDQNEILKHLQTSLVARLVEKGIGQPISLKIFWTKALECLRSDAYTLNQNLSPILFAIDNDSDGDGEDMFKEENLKAFFVNGHVKNSNIIHIGQNHQAIKSKKFQGVIAGNTDDVLVLSEKSELLFAFVRANELTVFWKGGQIKIIPDIFSLNPIGLIKGKFPASRYRQLIQMHYDEEVAGERRMIYWKNKAKWQLISSPEDHFRKRLGGYLNLNISDGHVDEEALNDNTDNRTDIRIILPITKQVYIFEVKWLGKSVGASYDGTRAHTRSMEGIVQLETYVKSDLNCIRGVLVLYDARKDKVEIIWKTSKDEWDTRIDQSPFFLHLDPTSASSGASTTVRSMSAKTQK